MTKIKHYTKIKWVKSIVDDNLIKLEGNNIEETINVFKMLYAKKQISWFDLQTVILNMKGSQKQFKLIGQYVWFTTEKTCTSCVANNPSML